MFGRQCWTHRFKQNIIIKSLHYIFGSPLLYRPSLEKGLDQLNVTLYALSTYPFVHNQLIRTIFEDRPVHRGVYLKLLAKNFLLLLQLVS